jgi:hypothetical protein
MRVICFLFVYQIPLVLGPSLSYWLPYTIWYGRLASTSDWECLALWANWQMVSHVNCILYPVDHSEFTSFSLSRLFHRLIVKWIDIPHRSSMALCSTIWWYDGLDSSYSANDVWCPDLIWDLSSLPSVQFLRTVNCNWCNHAVSLNRLPHCLCSFWDIELHMIDCFHLLIVSSKLLDWWIVYSVW